MSSQTKQTSISGTQSPPLEATGSDKPMGVSSIDGAKPEWVSDKDQRQEYFKTDSDHLHAQESRTQNQHQKQGETQAKKMGQSLAQSFEESRE
ncbi:hypothetical protein CPB83DRAFT_851370 [Crepidotus variabilis]|uniref:Uncharacterized protein n=1 Tax=Crepidotus variabilis TaxID=179855 RepID=A0A9P6JR24_9AGAR|nr:hypothetical protein CPB83DRAFT_851370 [Crepidotus variabilis]